jgi:UDP-4-amino-4,6-dideoxy-N-acetyl-beta-L-altrosamine transaminase
MSSSYIPYGRQSISQDDIEAVKQVLESDWLTQGPAIERFEQEVARYCGAEYAVAVCNATAALHLAALTTGLSQGKRLWTSPITFVASANCGLYCGADVDFVDIDPKTYNISVSALEQKLTIAKKEGRLPHTLVPVHLAGQSAEMKDIHTLSKKYGFAVVEDASHAVGGDYLGKKVGSCQFSDMAVFSFHPVKIITTGEGGMILTNRKDLYQRLTLLRSHGITRDPSQMTSFHGSWYYEQLELGYNYRITDIQAALGLSQFKRVDRFIENRRALADRYCEQLEGLPVVLPYQHRDTRSSFHLFIIQLRLKELKKTHQEIFEALRAENIGVNLHYIPVHLQPYYKKLGFQPGSFPEAEKYYASAISLPLYADLSEQNQDRVVNALKRILS